MAFPLRRDRTNPAGERIEEMSKGAGGGINSRQRVEKPMKLGRPAHEKSVKAISQIGSQVGNRATGTKGHMPNPAASLSKGPFGGPGSTPLGNERTHCCGVGVGRNVQSSGSQGRY